MSFKAAKRLGRKEDPDHNKFGFLIAGSDAKPEIW